MTTPAIPIGNVLQLGYVARDIDAALPLMVERYGLRDYHLSRDRDGNALHIAQAWIGNTMVEVLQPRDPQGALYGWALPDDPKTVKLHHYAMAFHSHEDWQGLKDALAAADLPIVAEGSVPDFLDFIYADTRDDLGHMMEYFRLEPAAQSYFDGLPRN